MSYFTFTVNENGVPADLGSHGVSVSIHKLSPDIANPDASTYYFQATADVVDASIGLCGLNWLFGPGDFQCKCNILGTSPAVESEPFMVFARSKDIWVMESGDQLS